MLPDELALDHRPRDPLGAEDHVLEVGPVEGVPSVLGRLEQRRIEHATGVVDQDADRPELGQRLPEGAVDLVGVTDVDVQSEAAHLLPGGGGGLRGALPDGDLCAERGEPPSDPAPDARTSAGDDRDAVGEQHGRGVDWHGGRQYSRHVDNVRELPGSDPGPSGGLCAENRADSDGGAGAGTAPDHRRGGGRRPLRHARPACRSSPTRRSRS